MLYTSQKIGQIPLTECQPAHIVPTRLLFPYYLGCLKDLRPHKPVYR